MTTSKSRIADSVSVEVNGEPTVKGPAKDRLENHRNEVRRFKESSDKAKGPAKTA